MKRLTKTALVATALAVGSMASVANASTFVAWKVTDVAWGDTLNVRKFPASHSQKRSAVPNGTTLQMTGKCTGGVDLFAISSAPAWKQRAAVRTEWCQVWHDPKQNGNYETGWVYGRYIRPN